MNVFLMSQPQKSADKNLMLALLEPDIPQNAGTMLRACACLGVDAAIIEPAGFPVSDRHFRRAGMDYLDYVSLTRHISFTAFEAWRATTGRRLILLSTHAAQNYVDFTFQPDDILMVGRESAGAPPHVHEAADARIRIKIRGGLRSLNVAVAAAMILGEAMRQTEGAQAALTEPAQRVDLAPLAKMRQEEPTKSKTKNPEQAP